MARQYYRKSGPNDQRSHDGWVQMSGKEFYAFVSSPEGKQRYFIDLEDVVLEATKEQYTEWLREKRHSEYMRMCEAGWETVSLYSSAVSEAGSGEEIIPDTAIDVETEAIENIRQAALREALLELDCKSFLLINALYGTEARRSERDLASEFGVSQPAIHKQKKKILEILKFSVIKREKNRQ